MGLTKTEGFTDTQNRMSQLTKAMGHPARVAIVQHLLKVNSCICKDIVDELPLSQPTISQHLRELKKVGLIKGNIEGNAVCYCLDVDGFRELTQYYSTILSRLESESGCC